MGNDSVVLQGPMFITPDLKQGKPVAEQIFILHIVALVLLVRDKDKEDLTTFILHTVALVLYVSQLRVLTIPVAAQGIPK